MHHLLKTIALFFLMLPLTAHAILSMELTRGVAGAIPIAINNFTIEGSTPNQDVAAVIRHDLQNSGRFKVQNKSADNVVTGRIDQVDDQYRISFTLREAYNKEAHAVLIGKTFRGGQAELRAIAHHISDLVYEKLTGTRGVFSTKIVYVLVQHAPQKRYSLEVSDQDGYHPRPLLNSPQPIMSPTWAPDGKHVAYVSFEKRRAGIYKQNILTGARELISEFPGINGAPSFSPNGKKMALVLSKTGSLNIYVMDIATHALTQITKDNFINTEPAWSPDGSRLLFTSDREGGPQLYQVDLATRHISRLTYDGTYNARGAFTQDGRHISMIHRVGNKFNIAILDLNSGTTRVLNGFASDSASPALAPNGSMVLYDMVMGAKNVLGMVSADGTVQLVLPARNGDAQDPAWSPYLS